MPRGQPPPNKQLKYTNTQETEVDLFSQAMQRVLAAKESKGSADASDVTTDGEFGAAWRSCARLPPPPSAAVAAAELGGAPASAASVQGGAQRQDIAVAHACLQHDCLIWARLYLGAHRSDSLVS